MSDDKKSQDGKKRKTYYDYTREASKPISERKATVEGRSGKRPVRRHHLDSLTQADILRKIGAGQFEVPYKEYGGYWGGIAALARLGQNEFHPAATIVKAFEEAMSDPKSLDKAGRSAWQRFKDKRPRSKRNGLDFFGRIVQNFNVLQRIGGDDPYGLKLAQIGACIDLKPDEFGNPMARLRTGIPRGEPVKPLNELKHRQCSRSVEEVPSQISFPVFPVVVSKKRSGGSRKQKNRSADGKGPGVSGSEGGHA